MARLEAARQWLARLLYAWACWLARGDFSQARQAQEMVDLRMRCAAAEQEAEALRALSQRTLKIVTTRPPRTVVF